jgi:hypothetical protein
MIHNGFKNMMAALWQDLGLGDLLWSDQGAALLHLEDLTVELTLSEDGGYVLVSAHIAPLSEEPSRRREELNALLKFSLPSLMASRAAICFEDREGTTFAVARALCPCEIGLIHYLSEMIMDVVFVRNESLRVLTQDKQLRTPSRDRAILASSEGSLIFTP